MASLTRLNTARGVKLRLAALDAGQAAWCSLARSEFGSPGGATACHRLPKARGPSCHDEFRSAPLSRAAGVRQGGGLGAGCSQSFITLRNSPPLWLLVL